jgi:GDP-D-mannose dehydratase
MGVTSPNCYSKRSALPPTFSVLRACLSEFDVSNVAFQGYEVHGIKRHASTFNQSRIEHLFMHGLDQKIHTGSADAARPLKLHMHYGDVLDINSLVSIFIKVKPDEIYNLAAQSHVRTSFDMPV